MYIYIYIHLYVYISGPGHRKAGCEAVTAYSITYTSGHLQPGREAATSKRAPRSGPFEAGREAAPQSGTAKRDPRSRDREAGTAKQPRSH